jgi:hypothetical protein
VALTEEEQALIHEIEAAFDGVRLEDGVSLNMTEYYDSGGSAPEYAERAKSDEREDWRRIPDETLENFTVTFCFTDLKGFRFYIPAYMRWCVRNYRTSDCIIGEFTIYALTPTHYTFAKTSFQEWFTERQFAAILRFLKFAAENGDTYAERSLNEFESA